MEALVDGGGIRLGGRALSVTRVHFEIGRSERPDHILDRMQLIGETPKAMQLRVG